MSRHACLSLHYLVYSNNGNWETIVILSQMTLVVRKWQIHDKDLKCSTSHWINWLSLRTTLSAARISHLFQSTLTFRSIVITQAFLPRCPGVESFVYPGALLGSRVSLLPFISSMKRNSGKDEEVQLFRFSACFASHILRLVLSRSNSIFSRCLTSFFFNFFLR